jgi:hypothetical protein
MPLAWRVVAGLQGRTPSRSIPTTASRDISWRSKWHSQIGKLYKTLVRTGQGDEKVTPLTRQTWRKRILRQWRGSSKGRSSTPVWYRLSLGFSEQRTFLLRRRDQGFVNGTSQR